MITLTKQGALWRITLNRPEKANALTVAMLRELVEIAEAAQQVRGLIITGAGGVFSAGGDLDKWRLVLRILTCGNVFPMPMPMPMPMPLPRCRV